MKKFTVILFAVILGLTFLSSPSILEARGGFSGHGGWGGHHGGFHSGFHGGGFHGCPNYQIVRPGKGGKWVTLS